MTDKPAAVGYSPADTVSPSTAVKQTENPPFHGNLEDLPPPRAAPTQYVEGNGSRLFDFRQMASALQPSIDYFYEARCPSTQYGMRNPASLQYMPQLSQYGGQRPVPTVFAGAQQQQPQQQHLPRQYDAQPAQLRTASRPQPAQLQTQPPFPLMDRYPYGMYQPAISPVDMRFPQQGFSISYSPPGGYADLAHFARRESEPTAIPSFPRGPPRKPKQSGHAIWVGNLPPAVAVTDLKDHFSRDAMQDIESLFLMSQSNCAFVNYRTEAACIAAMNRFHDSRFQGVRLVCRLRRGSTTSTGSIAQSPRAGAVEAKGTPDGLPEGMLDGSPDRQSDGPDADRSHTPMIMGSTPVTQTTKTVETPALGPANIIVPEKFFVVKSLTLQDLEASVRNGIWATQSHNEKALNCAFKEADNVYLIFSANKSGEYFGYARMGSIIAGGPVPIASAPMPQSPLTRNGPTSIRTLATGTAPRGRIIDDSARGTVFWEAELSDCDESSSAHKDSEEGRGQDLARPFKVEWISTNRLPFYRTRGLRNPWNANREVKIARDGTELEPSVGKRLLQMFHLPPQVSRPSRMPQGGMPYLRA